MPAIEEQDRKQHAVLWTIASRDKYTEPKLNSPVGIKIRYEEKQQEVVSATGNTIGVDAIAVVDRDVDEGSIIWIGRLADVPDSPDNLKQVVGMKNIPDVKARNTRRVALLVRFNDTLPDLA